MRKVTSVILLITIVLSIIGTGCAKTGKSQTVGRKNVGKSKLEKIKAKGVIVLGTSAGYPPFEFHKIDGGKDQIVGVDIELAKMIAKKLGVKLKVIDMQFDGLLPALKTNKIDMIIAGMTPTEKRAKEVDFSDIYYLSLQSVVVKKELINEYKVKEDLYEKKVGTQRASIQEKLIQDKVPEAKLLSIPKIPDLILELRNDNIAALILEYPVASAYVAKNDDLAISEFSFKDSADGSAVAINKNNEDLLEVINTVITEAKQQKAILKLINQFA